jgi:hypothetical protein
MCCLECKSRAMAGTASSWTPQRRMRQAERVRCNRPWLRSTGPKSVAGKKKSSQNALRFRTDPEARAAYELIRSFLATGILRPALGELWLAADLNPSADEFTNDLFAFEHGSDEPMPTLGEPWAASYLNPMSDDFFSVLGFDDASDEGLRDEPVSALCESLLDHSPGDIEVDDDRDWFGDDDGGPQLESGNAQPHDVHLRSLGPHWDTTSGSSSSVVSRQPPAATPTGQVGDASDESAGGLGHNHDHGDRLDRRR